jgi:hypothetical protein
MLRNLGESKSAKTRMCLTKQQRGMCALQMLMCRFLVDLKQNSAKKLSVRADFLNPVRTNGQQGTDFGGLAIVQNYLT